jgi:hypothetical protein
MRNRTRWTKGRKMKADSKDCSDCKTILPLGMFYFKGGKYQDVCKTCFYTRRGKSKMWGWKERFLTLCGPSAEDAEKCRNAHERLMREIRKGKSAA